MNNFPDNHTALIVNLASYLTIRGYNVWADDSNWPQGRPAPVNGHIPHILATGSKNLLIEITTLANYTDETTSARLRAFTAVPDYRCYCFVPAVTFTDSSFASPLQDLEHRIQTWQLTNIHIRIYNNTNFDVKDF